jgi:hypothetical protein
MRSNHAPANPAIALWLQFTRSAGRGRCAWVVDMAASARTAMFRRLKGSSWEEFKEKWAKIQADSWGGSSPLP